MSTDPATFDPATATPEEVEAIISRHVQVIDAEITQALAQVDEFRERRKRWFAMLPNGRSRAENPDTISMEGPLP